MTVVTNLSSDDLNLLCSTSEELNCPFLFFVEQTN